MIICYRKETTSAILPPIKERKLTKPNFFKLENLFILQPKRYKSFRKINYSEFFLLYIASILVGYLIADPVENYFGIYPTNYPTFSNTSSIRITSAIFIAPIIEEILHRGFLSVNGKFLWSFLLCLVFMGTQALIQDYRLLSFFYFGLFICLLLALMYSKNASRTIVLIFRNHFTVYFYFVVIAFSVSHFGDIQTDIGMNNRIIILVISYFPTAIILGYIRLKYGLQYSIYFHALINLGVLSINTIIN